MEKKRKLLQCRECRELVEPFGINSKLLSFRGKFARKEKNVAAS